ncbi:hypothetical protein Btru_013358 [Bulinus truncatus]|nr:hypothetical protein Btru_013358 [Bulinus truncatus]
MDNCSVDQPDVVSKPDQSLNTFSLWALTGRFILLYLRLSNDHFFLLKTIFAPHLFISGVGASSCSVMSKLTDSVVRRCSKLHHGPAAGMCVVLYVLQAGLMDYFLVFYLSPSYLYWLVADFIVLVVLVISMVYSYASLERQRRCDHSQKKSAGFSISWLPWAVINVDVIIKIIIVVEKDALENEIKAAPSILGANTFKTAVAIGSCIFIFLLTTQHDAPLGSRRRDYIYDLTGHVVFDILDTADILDVLFNKEDRASLWNGLEEIILTLAALNLLLPTVPLITLSRTQFGRDSLSRPMIYLHRLLVVLAVNVPNLLTRLLLWQTNSVSISPFTLKNVILIGMTLYEFYEHKKEKMALSRVEPAGGRGDDSAMDACYSSATNAESTLDLVALEEASSQQQTPTVSRENSAVCPNGVEASELGRQHGADREAEMKNETFVVDLTVAAGDDLDTSSRNDGQSTSA